MIKSVALIVSFSLLSACVSKSTYEKLESENKVTKAELSRKEQQLASLQNDLKSESERRNKTEAELSLSKSERASLEGSVKELASRKLDAEKQAAEYKQIVEKFKSLIDSGKLKVKMSEGKMYVEMNSDILFTSGSAKVSAGGKAALAEVAKLLSSLPDRSFQVEGHTDNMPIKSSVFPSNWELASARAITVVKTMVEAGLPETRVSAASFGESRPRKSNDTKEGRTENRRIEITVVPDLSSLPGTEALDDSSNPQ